MRLSAPELLVDISLLSELKQITLEQGVLRIGALVTHSQIEASAQIRRHAPMLAEAVGHIARPAIRNRGTIGGSIAPAHPAGGDPAGILGADATICIAGKHAERSVKASHFFKGLFETDLRTGELVTAVEIPAQLDNERSAFLELARRHGDYAIVGLAAFRGEHTRLAFLN